MTLAIAIIVPLSLLIYSNSRITDAKETLRAEMKTMRTEMDLLRVEMNAMRAEILNEIKALRKDIEQFAKESQTAVRIHELEHHK